MKELKSSRNNKYHTWFFETNKIEKVCKANKDVVNGEVFHFPFNILPSIETGRTGTFPQGSREGRHAPQVPLGSIWGQRCQVLQT